MLPLEVMLPGVILLAPNESGGQAQPSRWAGVPRSSLYPGLLSTGGYGLGKVQALRQAAQAPGVAVDRYWLSVPI